MSELVKPCITCGQGKRMTRDELSKWITDQIDRLGQGFTELADELNHNKVPTLSSGKLWYASSVRNLYVKPNVSSRGGDRWGNKSAS